MVRLAISARNPGAAKAVETVLAALLAAGGEDLHISLFCGRPADERLFPKFGSDPRVATHLVDLTAASADDTRAAARLLQAASTHTAECAPDLLVCGLSGPDLGVDEALTHIVGPARTVAVQDFPGWVVEGFSGAAERYLCTTTGGAASTLRASGVQEAICVGALGAASLYQSRARNPRRPGVGFLGQNMHQLAAYPATVAAATRAAAALDGLTYRPHPLETAAERDALAQRLNGAAFRLEVDGDYEDFLTGFEVMASICSTGLLERLVLQAHEEECDRLLPPIAPVYVFGADSLRTYYDQNSDGANPELVRCGLATLVTAVEPDGVLETALTAAFTRRVEFDWRERLLRSFPPPCPDRAAQYVFERARASASS